LWKYFQTLSLFNGGKMSELNLDLACGQDKQEGYIGVDISPNCQADIIYDLEKIPWTFAEDNSVDNLYCAQYIEHIPQLLYPNGKDYLIAFMDECYRILKVGGKLTIIAPYYTSMGAIQDPTHRRFIGDGSFVYYNKAWRESQKLDHYLIDADFDFNLGYIYAPDWINRSDEARAGAARLYNNIIPFIQCTLIKRASRE
jgi:hypothetical protein